MYWGPSQWMVMMFGALVLLAVSCNRAPSFDSADENHNPHVLDARRQRDNQNFREAAESYEKALEENPRLAGAHLELGLISDEKLGDPIAAIYHYRRYLALRPDSEKRQLVEDFIERAKMSLASKLPQSPIVDPSELARIQNEKAAVLRDNVALRARVAELERNAAEIAVAQPRPAGSATEPEVLVTPQVASTNVTVVEPHVPAPVSNPTPVRTETAHARMHNVQKGDTLYSLALRYYGSGSAWRRIYEANRGVISNERTGLKIGQQIVIP
jgi:tetratricopeptide (TPR) repeat protein